MPKDRTGEFLLEPAGDATLEVAGVVLVLREHRASDNDLPVPASTRLVK